jgi:hypothetical protein
VGQRQVCSIRHYGGTPRLCCVPGGTESILRMVLEMRCF